MGKDRAGAGGDFFVLQGRRKEKKELFQEPTLLSNV